MTNWEKIDTYAKEWIKEAGERLKTSFEEKLNIETKTNPNDLVTNMDRETEQFFMSKITEHFPEHRIFGEEGMGHNVKDLTGIVWIVDPIDGTMNFIHQQRNFAISIGILEDGKGKIGLVYDVVHGELYHTFRGNGAFMNDKELPTLKPVPINETILSLNATWVTENKRIDPQILGALVRDVRGTRSYGSAALEMAFVAAGRLDAYISLRLAPWDFAGGAILIEEVGGEVSDLQGNPLDYLKGGPLFVSKPGLHQEIQEKYLKSL
ncbi:inositol monophosphatase family protein [Bacillus sp. V59.32b]|uniref:inositol monophosphatase family protein n=1 Tax=Bacillus sp. V59.32b TaxID=1758642 RepID=UPI000E3C766E|nr:inositol monophosphatase family protein [Bacillus sp. V59.32b]RFU60020.1 inositol monophosphatase family protein [Bacillus sp. V59.32b]